MVSARDRLHRVASRLVVFVGLVQALVAFSILFLPVFAKCVWQGNNLVCHRETYSQQGGNALGYTLLVWIIVVSGLAVISSRDTNPGQAFLNRWVAALSSIVVAMITGWSIGIAFVPGALLLLLVALLSG